MHQRRNDILVVLMIVALGWAFFAWLIAPDYAKNLWPSVASHQAGSGAAVLILVAAMVYCFKIEDKMTDKLAQVTGGRYFESEGLCFMPLVRVVNQRYGNKNHRIAEISLYYQSRYSGPCDAVIHLRPKVRAFCSHRGGRDVHFTFRCPPGGFGVVHQPVAVHPDLMGESVEVLVAAATNWPKTHGQKLRSHKGEPCGSFDVDWALAYRQSEHELNGELELHNPGVIHLAMPEGVSAVIHKNEYLAETFDEYVAAT